jgi:predicted transcriptional regulator
MQVQEVMSAAVACCTREDVARKAAEFMREAGSGAIPVWRAQTIQESLESSQIVIYVWPSLPRAETRIKCQLPSA